MLVDFTIVKFMHLALRYLLMLCTRNKETIGGYLEMEALTFFETRVVENELETRVTEL